MPKNDERNMSRALFILLMLMIPTFVWGQTEHLYLKGTVKCKGKGVPYASLQVKGTSIGVSCNDAGEYLFKVPMAHADDTVAIRSVGYEQTEVTVAKLRKNGNVELKSSIVTLKEVKISTFRSALDLLKIALLKVKKNYHQDVTYSTFYYRDWRAVNGELFLFDEAIMRASRPGYSSFDNKRTYQFDYDERELEDNYRILLKHRLLVYDRGLVLRETGNQFGTAEMMEYSDNEFFFDPVYTPNATHLFRDNRLSYNSYSTLMEFEDNGERYYLVRARTDNGMRCEYVIRRRDHAIVKITTVKSHGKMHRSPNKEWVNVWYNMMVTDTDSSIFEYDEREGHLTLTRYYNYTAFRLLKFHRNKTEMQQSWQLCKDWVLTDFTLEKPTDTVGDTLDMHAMELGWMFKVSDYTSDYWGKYNSVAVDTLPLRLLDEKLRKAYRKENK